MSREYQTIVKCAGRLSTALLLQSDIPQDLHAEGFLTRDVYNDIINPRCMLSESSRGNQLVSGIRKKVELSPTNFHTLVKLLRKEKDKYSDILKILEETYLPSEVPCDSQVSALSPQPQQIIGVSN